MMTFTQEDILAAVPEHESVSASMVVLRVIQAKDPTLVLPWMVEAVQAGWRWPERWMTSESFEVANHLQEMISDQRVVVDAHWKLYRPRRQREAE